MLRVAGRRACTRTIRSCCAAHATEIKARLAGPEDDADPCEEWGVEVQLITDATAAEAIVAGLPASVGIDIETAPRPGFTAAEQPWLKITRKGAPYKDQPSNGDSIGLDPYRAEPRTVQVYDPAARVVYVFDLRSVPLAALAGLWSRRLVAHNASFELAMLARQGVHPADVVDSMQLVGLRLGLRAGHAQARECRARAPRHRDAQGAAAVGLGRRASVPRAGALCGGRCRGRAHGQP